MRKCLFFFLLNFLLTLSAWSLSTPGNMLGEAASVKYSSPGEMFRFAEVGVVTGGSDENIMMETVSHATTIAGFTVSLEASLYSLNYELLGQKGGLFLSIPISIPMDVGLRPSFVQWAGPLYIGASASFVAGYYSNEQNEHYEPKPDDKSGKFDAYILFSLGGGVMIDLSDEFSIGLYSNWERVSFNSGGSTSENYGFVEFDFFDTDDGNYPPYAYRVNLTSIGVNMFFEFKHPMGFYLEYAPRKLMYNDGWMMLKTGFIFLY